MNRTYLFVQLILMVSALLCGNILFNHYNHFLQERHNFQNRTLSVLQTLNNLRASGLLIFGTTMHIDRLRINAPPPTQELPIPMKNTLLPKPLDQDPVTQQLNYEKEFIKAESLIFLGELDVYAHQVKEFFPDETLLLEVIQSSARIFWSLSREIIYPEGDLGQEKSLSLILNLNSKKHILLFNIKKAIQNEITKTREINESLDEMSEEIKVYFALLVGLYLFSIFSYFIFHRKRNGASDATNI